MRVLNRQGAVVVGGVEFITVPAIPTAAAPASRWSVWARAACAVAIGWVLALALISLGMLLFGWHGHGVLWGASGIGGAAFLKNLPQDGSYALNEDRFNLETERNDVNLPSVTMALGQGNPVELRIPNVGILANIKLVCTSPNLVVDTGGATTGFQWPWNIFKRLTLNANGQTSLISAEGLDFRARAQRVWRNPKGFADIQSTFALDANGDPTPQVQTAGTYNLALDWDFPIVHDDETLAGALFAQSDQNYLSLKLQPGAVGELFSANGSRASGTITITPVLTYFDIPIVQSNGRDVVVIPDLRWLHGFISNEKPFANTGEVKMELNRTSGQLLALMSYIANGDGAQIAPAALSEIRWVYGTNRKPRVQTPLALLHKNQRDYSGVIKPGYFVFDFEVDNAARDLVYPKGLTELAVEHVIPAGTTINANARVHQVIDSLYMGV